MCQLKVFINDATIDRSRIKAAAQALESKTQ